MLSPAVVRGSIVGSTPAGGGVAPHLGVDSNTTLKLNDFINFVKANAATGFTECPGGGSCSDADTRNAPGELISRAETARFFSCGAANGSHNPFP
jgi:hypothetical protein